MLPTSWEAFYFEALSCIVRPMSTNGMRRLKDGASIAWTKLVCSRASRQSSKYSLELPRALMMMSSSSATSGHLITDPIFEIALKAAA